MATTIIYPGTFDPLTKGHENLAQRAARLFQQVIVAIAENKNKSPLLSLEERVSLGRAIFKPYANIQVIGFSGLLVDLAKAYNAPIVLRGLRAVSDFEYEFQLASMNRLLFPELETLFLTPHAQYAFISSSLVREVAKHGGDISQFVHPEVAAKLYAIYPRS